MSRPILTGPLEAESFLDRLVFHRHRWAAMSGVSTGGAVFLDSLLWGTPTTVVAVLAWGAAGWFVTSGLGMLLNWQYRRARKSTRRC